MRTIITAKLGYSFAQIVEFIMRDFVHNTFYGNISRDPDFLVDVCIAHAHDNALALRKQNQEANGCLHVLGCHPHQRT